MHVCARARTHTERERDREIEETETWREIHSEQEWEGERERRRGRVRLLGIVSTKYQEVPRTKKIIGIDWAKVFAIINIILKGLLQIEGVKSKRRNPDD